MARTRMRAAVPPGVPPRIAVVVLVGTAAAKGAAVATAVAAAGDTIPNTLRLAVLGPRRRRRYNFYRF